MKFTFTILFSLLMVFSNAQTCIIGRLEKKKITIIADSKITSKVFGNPPSGLESLSLSSPQSLRKIGGGKYIYFAIAGIDFLNSFEVAAELCNNLSSIDSITKKFIDNRIEKLKEIADAVRNLDYEKYEFELKYKEPMQFLFFGFIKRTPIIIEIRLDIIQHIKTDNLFAVQSPSISVKRYVYTNKSKNFEATAIAYAEDIKDSINIKQTWIGKAEVVGERLMRKQINGRPEIVGAPIDILILRKNKKPIWKRIN